MNTQQSVRTKGTTLEEFNSMEFMPNFFLFLFYFFAYPVGINNYWNQANKMYPDNHVYHARFQPT